MDLQLLQRSEWKHLVQTSTLTLTRSSPLVDSLSSRGSPGAWIVTDSVPRLPPRLLERCRSRGPCSRRPGNGHGRSRGGPVLQRPAPARRPVVLPPRFPPASALMHTPPVLAGAAWSGQTCRNSPKVLGLASPWRPNAAPCSALQGHRLGSSGGPLPPPSAPASSGQGHLQEINRHPEGLYFAGQVGLSQRKSSGAPEERKQLVGVGAGALSVGSEQRGRPCPGSSRRSFREPRSHLRMCPPGSCSVQWAQFLPPCLLERAAPDCALGWGKDDSKGLPRMTQLWTPCRQELGSIFFLFSARNTGEFWPGQLAGPV